MINEHWNIVLKKELLGVPFFMIANYLAAAATAVIVKMQ